VSSRRRASLLGLALLGASLFALILARSGSNLFIDLGPGDEPFTHGFRSGWEREGPKGDGPSPFRWTEDGAWLEAPVHVRGPLVLRLRVARLTRTPAEITVLGGGRTLATWTQVPLGFRVRTIELGEWDGPLRIQFRSQAEGDDPLGVALEWAEFQGASSLRPDASVLLRLALLFVGVAVAVGLLSRRGEWGAIAGIGLSAVGIAAVCLDRLGGMMALANAAVPALVVTLALGAAWLVLGRRFPDAFDRASVLVPLAGALVALVALSHPAFYYPDVDTHAKLVDALDRDPSLALDPRPYQAATGAWTRGIAGRRVPFPYSPAFHAIAWPLAQVVGSVPAVKTLAAGALGLTLLLAHGLARAVGLAPGWARVAQVLVCLLPVTTSRLTLALYPALLAQALELLLLLALVRLLPVTSARGAVTMGVLMAGVQAAYTGSLLSVAVIVPLVALSEWRAGERASAVRLTSAWMGAAALVVALQYARFVPVLWHDVLPYASTAGADEPDAVPVPVAALRRLAIFFDHVVPGLVLLGMLAIGGGAKARRVWRSALAAGLALFVLRYALPALFRDAKEVELLAAPAAVAVAAAFAWLSTRGWGRAVAIASGAWIAAWGILRAAALYAERFSAIGR
jgi:hypothetical protein